MPVVGIPIEMLLKRVETELERDELVTHLQHLGSDMEGFATMRRLACQRCENLMEITETENAPVLCDRCGADFKEQPELLVAQGEIEVIRMELLPVRPDMFDPGGLARVLRHYLGETDQPASYPLAPPSLTVRVDPSVDSDDCRRPAIACAVVRGFTLTDDRIKVIMKLQENLHWAMGRDRKHASIGVYDLDTVQGPRLVYRAVGPDELRFVPLGLDPDSAADAMTPAQVLERHPKGVAYARLLADFARYPLLADENGDVLSMPPIINSERTRLRGGSTDFFIDVTGSGERLVGKALNVLVTSLLELDPAASAEQVTIAYPAREAVTPDLSPQLVQLDPAHTARLIGLELSADDVERLLRRMGHGVSRRDDGMMEVAVPAYRNDIMHPVDMVEDVAIAYGYHNVEPRLVPTLTVGLELPIERSAAVARGAMTGLGYMEVLTLLLSSPEANYDALSLPRGDDDVVIDNPISSEQTMVRATLISGLLETFSINTNHEMPQRVFEVGNIGRLDPAAETGASEHRRVGAAATGPRVDYSEIRATCEALLREFGWELRTEPDDAGCFIPGRGARVVAVAAGAGPEEAGIAVGLVGEVHPEVLERHKLVQPVALFEVDLEPLIRV